jgi:hypothetical protein
LLAEYIREPAEFRRDELIGHLRLHGSIRRDQGYCRKEVLAEFGRLANIVTRKVTEELLSGAIDHSPSDLVEMSTLLAEGLRSIIYLTMGTYNESDHARSASMIPTLNSLDNFANPRSRVMSRKYDKMRWFSDLLTEPPTIGCA